MSSEPALSRLPSKTVLPLRFGVIDLGANTTQLLIVQIWEDYTYTSIHWDKAMIRLGSSVFQSGMLDPRSQSNALAAIRKFINACQNHEVDVIRIVATSPLREARNSANFLEMIKQETGLEVNVISGREEARLTALAAVESLGLVNGSVMVIDAGGGSTEVAWVNDGIPTQLMSFNLGPVRCLEEFKWEEPIGAKGIENISRYLRNQFTPVFRTSVKPSTTLIGTSGTANALGDICGTKGRAKTSLETAIVCRPTLKILLNRLADMPIEKRMKFLGEHKDRADTILFGGMIFLTVMEELNLEIMVTGGKSLREGIVLDFLQREIMTSAKEHSERLVQLAQTGSFDYDPHSIREHNILKLARLYEYEPVHCHHVLNVANQLFDELRPLHWLGDEDRFYLQSAAVLHDIGYHISSSRHHHHSEYLVLNSDLEGFHQMEIRLIGTLVKYHSKEIPSQDDPNFGTLPERIQKKVNILAGILRIADTLDFTHQGLVDRVKVEIGEETLQLHIHALGPIGLEQQELESKLNLLESALNRKITFTVDTAAND